MFTTSTSPPAAVTFGGLSGSKLNVKVEATFLRNARQIGVKEVTGQKKIDPWKQDPAGT